MTEKRFPDLPGAGNLPEKGMKPERLMKALARAKRFDARWADGRTWSLVYHSGGAREDALAGAYRLFFAENALSPTAFPSLAELEKSVVSMCARLLGGSEKSSGTMTSGGTESILLAVKTHRDWFRKRRPDVDRPEVIIPESAHPAFFKAAHYFGLTPIAVPVNASYRLDPSDIEQAVSSRTALMVASAPSYPYGMVDPISALGDIARRNRIGLHVDACLGGMFLPFLRRLGGAVPQFDLSTPGVTSISTDLHKFGYGPKGSSVILYRSAALRRFQFFVHEGWPAGAYASPGMLGTRSGGVIAATWAALMLQGIAGYEELVRSTMSLRERLFEGIRSSGFEIVGEPDMAVFAFTSRSRPMRSVADLLRKKGWRIDLQRHPPSIHMIVTVNHQCAVDQFVHDLRVAATIVDKGSRSKISRRREWAYGSR